MYVVLLLLEQDDAISMTSCDFISMSSRFACAYILHAVLSVGYECVVVVDRSMVGDNRELAMAEDSTVDLLMEDVIKLTNRGD